MTNAESWPSREFRLDRYLGKFTNAENHMFGLNDHCLRHFNIAEAIIRAADGANPQIKSLIERTPYNLDDYLGLGIFGDLDHDPGFPCLVKARKINRYEKNSNNVICYANLDRHWNPVIDIRKQIIKDTPWASKKTKAVWRGALTHEFRTTNPRLLLVKKYFNHKLIDVGLTDVFWSTKVRPELMKPAMSIQEQLKCKYIISIEGYDVATNLQWAMCSNSIVLMPMPQRESWFLESCLIPWIHFVPINDNFDDLEDKIAWCIDNDDKCQEIVKNANDYINSFLDFEEEKKLESLVIQNYFDKITFTCNGHLKKELPHLVENKKNVVFV